MLRPPPRSTRSDTLFPYATLFRSIVVFSSSTIFMECIQRVEILRGPQSAQYGRNSFAGAINYITKKPTMDFEAGGSAVLGDGERRGITGFVNGALLPGQVAMRVDAGYDNSGGYYKDAVSGQDRKSTRLNSSHSCATRMPSSS